MLLKKGGAFLKVITNDARESKHLNLDLYYNPNDICLFDIETTGFAAEATTLYLIGCCYYENGKWRIKQWFNDDGLSEQVIISNFMEFISKYKYLMHYNGDGFDIPYISKKLSKLKLPYSFDSIESHDLYKKIKAFKNSIHIDNLKQKTLEKYLGINRLDKYSGGDLIKVYNDYLSKKTSNGETLLLQHNYEDLEGLLYCGCMLALTKLQTGSFTVTKMSVRDSRLLFSLSLDYPLPKRITLGINDILITGNHKEMTINAPIYSCELKFFFDNFKEYYYLPAEDMAIHKSVAAMVDKNYREQAKKENCYLRHTGHYIAQFGDGVISGYKNNYYDQISYIELCDSFLQDIDMLNAYARHIVATAINNA